MKEKDLHQEWFNKFRNSEQYSDWVNNPIAYFCTEYALFDYPALYAGGLGVLSGDYFKEIVDQKFPAVAVGLFYHKEHVHNKSFDLGTHDPNELGLTLLKDDQGESIKIVVPIGWRDVYIQAWQWKDLNSVIILLDTKIPENHPDDQVITDMLYIENRDLRLKQEIILGIGGMRFLEIIGAKPSLYHLNEGHSSFMVFELIRQEIKKTKCSIKEAMDKIKKKVVFTNHTLIEAGLEKFSYGSVEGMLHTFAKEFGTDIKDLMSVGTEKEASLFSMTKMALNLSHKVNAVSKLHEEKAALLWPGYNLHAVTNGIYLPRWDSLENVLGIEMWNEHQNNKYKLLTVVKNKTGKYLDPDAILLGWARRFVPYKQPLALLEDVQRFKKMALEEGRKIHVIYSGPVNLSYSNENEFLSKLEALIENELSGIVVFLPDYDIELSKLLVAGCDVWLNTPVVGKEACGTSGMKACLNGVLPLSTNDGWIAEVDVTDIGWIVEDNNLSLNLLNILENEIVPLYYEHLKNPSITSLWFLRMQRARKLIQKEFSTARTLKDYIEKLYIS